MTANKMTTEEMARKAFMPERKEPSKSDEATKYVPKDEIFTKKKSYMIKNKEGVREMKADWRKINIAGKFIVLHKGVPVLESELEIMKGRKGAVEHYLNAPKKGKAPKADDVNN
jgi:hypothetical protein